MFTTRRLWMAAWYHVPIGWSLERHHYFSQVTIVVKGRFHDIQLDIVERYLIPIISRHQSSSAAISRHQPPSAVIIQSQ